MDWTGASETVAGLCLRNKLDPNAVNPASLQPPYDTIVRLLREGKQEVDILEQVNMQPIFVAKDAADAFAGAAGDAVELAERASVRRDAGKALLPIVRQLERGQDGDVAGALAALSRLERGHREFTTLTETDPEEDIFVPTFYQPIDKYMGGIPDSNMTIVAGGTGVGKTTFLTELAISAAKHDKKTAIFSLEMTTGQIHRRVIELDKDITERQKERILITDGVYDVHEVYATASRLAASHPDLHWIGIDYADYMVRGKQDEQSMGEIYSTISILAKKLGMPVILLAQYRRTDQEPTINDIKYSGRAEQSSGMIMLLWNPGMTYSRNMNSSKLPRVEGRAYIILGKSRFRSSAATLHGTGAVQVEWIEDGGRWGDKGLGEWTL